MSDFEDLLDEIENDGNTPKITKGSNISEQSRGKRPLTEFFIIL